MDIKDPLRRFSFRERRALYWVANGKCDECGTLLDPKNWHADHIHPHSKGGRTDIINGRALCPNCNLRKGSHMRYPYAQLHLNDWPTEPPLRRWQDRFLERWLLLCDPKGGGQKNFLMAVVPAAGKTTASLKAAHEGLSRGWFGRLVIVVPSRNLVEQWIKDAGNKGIALKEVEDYGTGVTSPEDFAGIVTTYQSVASNPERFKAYTTRVPTLIIGDEIHHCGEKENLAWAEGMLTAFDHDFTMRLVSSGTPFRTDKATIPFTIYNDATIERDDGVLEIQKVVRTDFEYSYGEALRDGVVRDIFFPTWDGKLSWRRGGEDHTHTFQDDLIPQLASDRLRSALDTRGEWLPEVIKNAHERLMTIRREEGHSNAGGLIVCRDQAHANAIAEIVKGITGIDPAIAHSDISEASNVINEFKENDSLWMVSVRMVSEGVDIKRLRVGIYATTFKTRMSFLQTIARTTRYDSTVPGLARDGQPVGQPAWFYVPDDPDLQNYMAQLMEISIHHIADGLPKDYNEDNDFIDITETGQTTFLDGYEFLDGADAVETGHFYEEKKWTSEQMDRGIRAFDGIPAFNHVPPAAKALAVERVLANQVSSEPRSPQREQTITSAPGKIENLPSQQDKREKLKKACSTQIRSLTYLLIQTGHAPKDGRGKSVFDFSKAVSIVTGKINSRFGVQNIGESTNEKLNERRELLAKWISDVKRDSWDSSLLD